MSIGGWTQRWLLRAVTALLVGSVALLSANAAQGASSRGFKPDPGLGKVTAKALPLITIGTGKNPNLLVDAAGTAHIIYTEDGGSSPDTVAVCNLQRGRKSCAQNATAPTPQAPTAADGGEYAGNFPGGNHDTDGAVPLAIENQLYVVERRFPDAFPTPGGTSDSNVFEWQSSDGGNTLTGPGIIGDNQMAGGAIIYGDPSAPSIGTISRLETGGTFFQGTPPGGYAGDAKAQLGSGDQDVGGSIAPDMSGAIIRPVAAYADNSGNTFVREWSGSGDINDPATWSAPTTVAGYSPQIVGGPAGVYLLTSSSDINGGTMTLRHIIGGVVSGATTLGKSMSEPAISESAAGVISYAFTDSSGVEDETSTNGANFSPAQLAAAAPGGIGVGHLVTAATGDGGGFISYIKNGTGAEDIGQVVVGAFGTQATTGLPGLGPLPGGGIGSAVGDQLASSSCSSAKFGDVDAEIFPRYGSCFVPDPLDRNMSVSLGTVDLNGLLLIPDKGVRIGVDAKLHKIQTSGPVRVVLRANGIPDITLYHGPLSYEVPQDGDDGDLFSPYLDGAGLDLLGFPIAGDVDPKLTKGGVQIAVTLKLPSYLGGITGTANLTAKSFQGVDVDSLNFSVGDVLLGGAEIKNLLIKYARTGEVWAGSANLLVPAGGAGLNLTLGVEFDHGKWVDGHVDFGLPYPGEPLGESPPALFFTHGGLDLNFAHGTTLAGSVGFGSIPIPLAESPGPQDFLFAIEAGLKASFASPVTLTLTGQTFLYKIPIGQETLTWQLPDNLSFLGSAHIAIGPVDLTGQIGGQIEPSHHQYGAFVTASGTVFGFKIANVGIAINQKGFGISLPEVGGVCYFADQDCHIVVGGDTTTRFKNPPLQPALARRAHVANLASVQIPKGAPSADLIVSGAGGPPSVVLISPSGQVVTPTALTRLALPAGAQAVSAADTAASATDVGLIKPQAGTWRVAQAPGSPVPVSGVQYAIGERSPTARASVSGPARRRVLHYRVSIPPDAAITFVEQTKRLRHVIGRAKGRSGAIRFTPADGGTGRRSIVAELTNNGLPIRNVTVAHFIAPGPLTPGRAQHLRVTASTKRFSYHYTPPANATRVLVTLVTSDSRHIQRVVDSRSRGGVLAVLGRPDTLTVSVVGISSHGRRGRSTSARAKVAAVKSRAHPPRLRTRRK